MTDLARRLAVARGDEPADTVVRGGRVFCVFTREWLDADVAIADGVIAGVGDYQGDEVVDASGRFVVPGISATDRARVLLAYASGRGLDRRRRHRLAAWVMRKITARRCAIDRFAPEVAARAGFRALMRSGGPFDPAPGSG